MKYIEIVNPNLEKELWKLVFLFSFAYVKTKYLVKFWYELQEWETRIVA